MRLVSLLSLVSLIALPGPVAAAPGYPDRPVRLIISYPAGGATDTVGRVLAEGLSQSGLRVIVENRGGASGMLGSGFVAKAAPDGHTLVLATATTHAVNPALFRKTIPYDALKDFTPISFVASTPLVLLAHPSVPASDVQELIGYVKSRGDTMTYATGGMGSVPHMAGELFNRMAGISITPVHYPGDAPATTTVLGGHLPYLFAHLPLALPQIADGKLKALGVTTLERSTFAPQLPTIAEQGLPGYQIFTWWGLFGPAGLPPDIVATLNADVRVLLSDAAFKERAFKLGYEVRPSSAAEFAAFVNAEYVKWGKIVAESGMRPDE